MLNELVIERMNETDAYSKDEIRAARNGLDVYFLINNIKDSSENWAIIDYIDNDIVLFNNGIETLELSLLDLREEIRSL